MKILIIKFRNIGDVLLVTPLISNVKQYYPDAIIDIAVNAETAPMLANNPEIDSIVRYDRKQLRTLGIFKRLMAEWKFISQFKHKYDLVINLTSGDRGNAIVKFSGAKTTIGFQSDKYFFKNIFTHTLPKQAFRHTVETHLDPLALLEIPVSHTKVSIHWNTTDADKVNSEFDTSLKFIHIHPVSRWLFKCINDQTFAHIIEYIKSIGYEVVITASPDPKEQEKVSSILRLTNEVVHNFAGTFTLSQVAYLNSKSKMFIGVDTAIMHMSAANDIPTLAFFGPSGADHWGPWDNNLIKSGYTNRNGIQHMGKHTVIAEQRSCQPCGQDGCNGTKISDCLMNIDVHTITTEIQRLLHAK